MIHPYWRALRPHQWVKNLLVYAAPAGAGAFDDVSVLGRTTVAFVAFCAASSAGYLVNDLVDREADRRHPTKSMRPIAAGLVSITHARVIAFALASAAVLASVVIRPELAIVTGTYLLLTVTYSMVLKRVPVVEMGVLAGAFVLRAHAGAVAIDVPSSGWFLLVVSAVGGFVIVRKRFCELIRSGAVTRPVLRFYRPSALAVATWLGVAISVVGHTGWAFTGSGGGAGRIIATGAFAAATVRYGLVTAGGDANGDPVLVMLRDPLLALFGAAWALGFAGAAW